MSDTILCVFRNKLDLYNHHPVGMETGTEEIILPKVTQLKAKIWTSSFWSVASWPLCCPWESFAYGLGLTCLWKDLV